MKNYSRIIIPEVPKSPTQVYDMQPWVSLLQADGQAHSLTLPSTVKDT